jgi:DNA-binding helix-hairpin-helix protein with protein kinase domain
LELRWKALVSPREFLKYHGKLVEAKKALNNLGDEHERKVKDVHSSKHQDQLDSWLDKHKIAPGEIKGISSAALAILQSYGIETAKDLRRKNLAEVPTIGSARVKALLAWRLQLEKKFMFDSGKGVDPMSIATVGREIDMKRAELVQVLAEGSAKLKHIARQTHLRRVALKTEFDAICETVVTA